MATPINVAQSVASTIRSSSVASTIPSSVTTPKRNRSVAWRHFDKDSPGNESKYELCGDLVKDSGNTTNLFEVRSSYMYLFEGETLPVYFYAAS